MACALLLFYTVWFDLRCSKFVYSACCSLSQWSTGVSIVDNDVPGSFSKGKAIVEGSASKNRRGRAMNIDHFREVEGPTHFSKVVLAPKLESIRIPDAFREHMGTIPKEIVLRTNIGCDWSVKFRDINGNLSIDQGWAGFDIAHCLTIEYLLTSRS